VQVRFNIYRNNVFASLIEALADNFPVVQALVGTEFFGAMARQYLDGQMPRSPVLARWGGDFPDFIGRFAPAASVPYLADVARLEWARQEAFHAADAPVLAPEAIARALDVPERVPNLRWRLHPSLHTLVSPDAIVSLWAAHQRDPVDLSAVTAELGEAALVIRPSLEVHVLLIDAATHVFFSALQCAESLGVAVTHALETDAKFDYSGALALLIHNQAVSALEQHPGDNP
jgi:hypothetical protein